MLIKEIPLEESILQTKNTFVSNADTEMTLK